MTNILMKLIAIILLLWGAGPARIYAQTCAGVTKGWDWQNGSHFNGFKWFPSSKMWNNISAAPVHANSSTWMSEWRAGDSLLYTFPYIFPGSYMLTGTANFDNNNYAIEIVVVDKNQPRVNVYCGGIATDCYEHDPSDVPIPVPMNPRVQAKCGLPGQGCPKYNTANDKHVILLDKDECVYYELYNTFVGETGKLYATSVSIWDALGGDAQRPLGWTSGSQAGVPWFMGAIRYEEVASGNIQHAIAMTGFGSSGSNTNYFDSSWAGHGNFNVNAKTIPYGARARLKASYDVSGFSPQVQTIMNAMKTYGVFILDGGRQEIINEQSENWSAYLSNYQPFYTNDFGVFFSQTNFDIVDDLGTVSNVLNSGTWPAASLATISSFTVNGGSSATISLGQSVTFAWATSGGSNNLVQISKVGALRGTSGSRPYTPTHKGTETYKLYVVNRKGQTTSSTVTVTVN